MLKSIEVTGKTEAIAIENAVKELGLDRDDFSVEVIARAKTGFLGIGSQPARIKVTYEVPDEDVKVPEPQPDKKPEEKKPRPEKKTQAEKNVKEEPTQSFESKDSSKKKQEKLTGTVKKTEKVVYSSSEKEEEKSEITKPTQKKASKTNSSQSTKDEKKTQPQSEKAIQETPKSTETEKANTIPSNPEDFEEGSVEARTYAFLTGLLEQMGSNAQISIRQSDGNTYQVELVGQQLGSLIGRRGETLDAIQQLTNYSVNRGQSHRVRIHLDAENYRAKREESLQRLARKTAGKVVKNRRNITLEPMNAYERHVIHTALQEYRNVTTYSIGTEPNRRIVIAYTRGEPKNYHQ